MARITLVRGGFVGKRLFASKLLGNSFYPKSFLMLPCLLVLTHSIFRIRGQELWDRTLHN